MPSFEKFANKLRETFDEGATQFRVVELQMLWHLDKLVDLDRTFLADYIGAIDFCKGYGVDLDDY